MDLQAAVVVDEAQLPEPVHEVAHPRTGGADHGGQRLLAPLRDHALGPRLLAEMREQQQDTGQPLSLELKSWSTRSSSIRTLRERMYAVKSSANSGSRWSHATMIIFATRMMLDDCIALAVDMRKAWPARQPSPKKLPCSRTPMTASFPRVETTVSLTLPVCMKNTASAASPLEKTNLFFQ